MPVLRMTLVGILALLAGCGGGGDPVSPAPPPPPPPAPAPVAVVELSPGPALNLAVGGTAQLSAALKDAQGRALSGRAVSWSSSAQAVAAVSASGLVTAASVGNAQIRATSEGKSGEVTVTVSPIPVAAVSISAVPGPLVPNQTLQLSATLTDAGGNQLTGRPVDWSSSAGAIATVSAAGLLTAVAVGNATITATSEGKTAQAALSVIDGGFMAATGGLVSAADGMVTLTLPAGALATGIAITVTPVANPPPHPRMVPGTAFEFGPNGTTFAVPITLGIRYDAALPAGWAPADFRMHRWSGTAWVPLAGSLVNAAIRTVTGQTAGFSIYAIIEVPPPVEVVTLDPTPTTVVEGASKPLNAILKDASNSVLTGRAVSWSSSNEAIATVSLAGVVSGIAVGGPVTISATSEGKTGTAQVTVLERFRVSQITASQRHACAILVDDGSAWCWGANGIPGILFGMLGEGGNALMATRPVAVLGGHSFTQLATGYDHTCGVTPAYVAWCWGRSYIGEAGTGSNQTRPGLVPGGHRFDRITAASVHTCALTPEGAAYCWGSNFRGQLGQGVFGGESNTPLLVTGGHTFKQISAGAQHVCALTAAGAAYCWGYNDFGELGSGSLLSDAKPSKVTNHVFDAVTAGDYHTCGRTPAGEVWCWGADFVGQLGDNSTDRHRVNPIQVVGGDVFLSVAAGGEFTCGITTDQLTKCWGRNSTGQVGVGITTAVPTPVLVSGQQTFVKLGLGTAFSCAITDQGIPWCWGQNSSGQLGDGTTVGRNFPKRVLAP